MQKQSTFVCAFLALTVFALTAPALALSQSSPQTRTDQSDAIPSTDNPNAVLLKKHPQSEEIGPQSAKSTDEPTQSDAYQRDMEQRFPHSTSPDEDITPKSRHLGS